MPSSKRHRPTKKSSNANSFELDNAKHVNYLLSMITNANTTSVLNQLEHHRQNLTTPLFQSLLLLLTTKLNDKNWMKMENDRYMKEFQPKRKKLNGGWKTTTKTQIDSCRYTILCYIVAIIHKYKILSVEDLWNEILGNSLTRNIQFYRHLHEKQIRIPKQTRKLYSEKFESFYARQSARDRLKLMELGFISNAIITMQTPIKDVEQILFILKQREDNLFEPEKFIINMNTPEKLSLFLSHFPDYDINRVDKQSACTVLEQLIRMKPYFYLSVNPSQSRRVPIISAQLGSHPNEMFKYRAVRIVNLLQQLISRGAQLSERIYSDTILLTHQDRFFATSIGMYVLLGLNMNDIYPCSQRHNDDFVSVILKNIERFGPDFRKFILHHLAISCPIVHEPRFIDQRRKPDNELEQEMDDAVFQQPIKLKEWCRLKIKDNCSQKNIKQLNLSNSLINYCSFGLSDPDYALKCIGQVTIHNGNRTPKRRSWFNFEDNHQI